MTIAFAKALHVHGIPERTSVTICGCNSPEHIIAFMATICSNCVASDIYLTNAAKVCLFQVKHAGSQVIVVDTYKRLRE